MIHATTNASPCGSDDPTLILRQLHQSLILSRVLIYLALPATVTQLQDIGTSLLLTAAIVAARIHVEAATRRALIEQAWRIHLDRWPRKRILPIPVAPLIAGFLRTARHA